MKGVILAGGLGTRLRPLTLITNKHLLPVYDKPMILYPLETLKKAGVSEVMVVCGKEHAGHFMNFLGSGKEYGVKLSYAIQNGNGGIADALSLTEDFADNSNLAVILGDNIFEGNFGEYMNKFKRGATVFFKKVPDPKRFGVAVFDKTGKKLLRVEEKPQKPKSDFAQTGLYIFDSRVFGIIKTLKPSSRGELEITDVTNWYLTKGELQFNIIKGFWSDAGTFDSLFRASSWMAGKRKRFTA